MRHATLQHVAQVGPYEYESQTKVMDLEPETTLREMVAWYKRVTAYPSNREYPIHFQISVEIEGGSGE